ncbi:MAG: DNA-binding protein [Saprospiraceae bacterium]
MNITFKELRDIKHSLPTGSVSRIANDLGLDQQTVRNYFGAQKFISGINIEKHLQPGPEGGIVSLMDTTILDAAKKIISDSKMELEEA